MSATIPQIFKETHRLRKHLRELKDEIERGPRVMKAQLARLAAEEKIHKEHGEGITKLKLKIREDELSLKQNNTQLAKFEKQLDDAGSPKEYEAKQSEIRQAKERIEVLEMQILTQMEDLDNRIAAVPAVDKQWADARAEFEQYKVDAKERLERMQADQKECQALLAKTETTIPPDVKGQYDRLVKQYGPDGLAAVEGRNCQQCNLSVTEQQKQDLQRGQFVCCANCGRALYVAG